MFCETLLKNALRDPISGEIGKMPDELEQHADAIVALKNYFKAYATDSRLRNIIAQKRFTELNVNPSFRMADFKAVPQEWRSRIPGYIKDYLSLNQFM